MDIIQFQNKLKEIQTLALNNGKKVQAVLVEKFFEDEEIDREKLQKVYDYLEIQGIRVEGAEERKQEEPVRADEKARKEEEYQEVPLTAEEEEFLEEYMETFAGRSENREELLEAFLKGKEEAREGLVRSFQKEVVFEARRRNREEIFFGDLLQEGNMGLLGALDRAVQGKGPKSGEAVEAWILEEIQNTMRLFIEEQTQQKREDQILVEKVRNLEAKMKELTEEENVKYSVEELAVFLDMDQEEMEAVLRLAGEEGQ